MREETHLTFFFAGYGMIFSICCHVFKFHIVYHVLNGNGENIYEKTRKYWRLNPIRAKKADFVLAVFQGVVRAVYKPMSWFPIQDATLFTGTRYAFDGIEIKDSKYLNKDISKYIGGMSPIRYINI